MNQHPLGWGEFRLCAGRIPTHRHQPPPAPRLTAEELNWGNPNNDSYWQARRFRKRPKDWKRQIADEEAAKAKRLQMEQRAAARAARIER